MLDRLIEAFSGEGLVFMYAITLVGAYSLSISIDRIYSFWFRWKCDWDTLHKTIKEQNWDEAEKLSSNHPVSNLFVSTAHHQSTDDIWDQIGSAAPEIEEKVEKRIGMISACGNIATMLGLLGTVYGLIFALQGLEQANMLERSTRLSEGISTAMLTTAWGLIVGVPCLAAHAFLSSKSNRILSKVEAVAALIAQYKKRK